jgi:hypothetical protein
MAGVWYARYVISMFTYGTYRGFRADYKDINSHDYLPIGTKAAISLFNGMLYSFTPYGFLKLLHTADRIDINLRQIDTARVNGTHYEELIGMGVNKHVI